MTETSNHNAYNNESISLIFDLNAAILSKWNAATDQITEYEYVKLKGANGAYEHEVIAAVRRLYYAIRYSIKNDLKGEDKKILLENITTEDVKKVLVAFDIIDAWLYKKGVTKFDTKEKYDRSRVEQSNRKHGL